MRIRRLPGERIAFLRDTVVALSEHRKQDQAHWNPISTAADVLAGYQGSVRLAQLMVGDPVDAAIPFDPQAKSTLMRLSSRTWPTAASSCLRPTGTT